MMVDIENMASNSQNLHTHSIYCDGKDTLEDMVVAAQTKGFQSVGFSMHSFMRGQSISQQIINDYKQEINILREKYANKIEIYCGLECEMYGDTDLLGFDYLIGAIHYFRFGDEFVAFDRGAQDVRTVIEQYFEVNTGAMARG